MSSLSRPVGARTMVRRSVMAWSVSDEWRVSGTGCTAEEPRYSCKDSFKIRERLTNIDSALFKDEFANRTLVGAAALLQNGQRLAYLTGSFKVSEKQHCVCQIAQVDRSLHGRSYQTVLRQRDDGCDPLLAEIGK